MMGGTLVIGRIMEVKGPTREGPIAKIYDQATAVLADGSGSIV